MEIIVVLVAAGGIVWLAWQANSNRQNNLAHLKHNYELALRGTKKAHALEAGRKYMQAVRKGPLTIYDEQWVTNDLSAMKA